MSTRPVCFGGLDRLSFVGGVAAVGVDGAGEGGCEG